MYLSNSRCFLGMWGVKCHLNRPLCERLAVQMLVSSKENIAKYYDQRVLAQYLFPLAKDQMVSHETKPEV